MSFADILNKLAEKKALQGDSDFAYRLISASEKEEEKEAEMIKRGKDHKKVASKELWIEAYEELVMMLIPKFMERGLGEDEAEHAAEQYLEKHSHLVDERAGDLEGRAIDRAMMMHGDIYASSLSKMIKKYAGKDRKKLAFSDESWLDSWLKAREDLFMQLIPKFIERGMEKYEAEMAAEQYLEKHPHLIDEKAAILDEGRLDQGIMMADDIYASSLSDMIKKYAGENKDEKKETSQEFEEKRRNKNKMMWERRKQRWDKYKAENPNYKKSSTLNTMIKKYAKEYWEVTGEEFYGGETPDLDFEDDNQFYDAMGRGFEDAKYDPESQSNPYSGNAELTAAYEAGVRHALEMLQQRGTKL